MPNPIADPLVEGLDRELDTRLVQVEATPEGIATVTLNRPLRRNAMNAELIAALTEAFETLQGAEGVRAVFVRGAGGIFSAGADLEWMQAAVEYSEADNREDAAGLARMLKTLWDMPSLTVALIEGAAIAGGAGLAAACDMAISTAGAKFSFSEARLGLVAAIISPYVIDAIGPRNARGLFASARPFDVEEALRIGLVTEVVADAAALDEAQTRIGRDILSCAPGAVTEAKRLVEAVKGRDIDHGLMDETVRWTARARVGEEGQEGVRAYLGKRRPSWMIE
ncbi:enoyl-CoA hydratase-related protein [Phenylobacterium sp.]|uniref:enoyl-CoA hydratase-related protein n=2 Tax=Phenylobacterium sp. TaxID=1871053 RepID=UPI0027333AD4|nr:enoyl-CoA hydratase-related protein [Phenylobacterium sp.]MDP3660524.1 enoyl-CoA hydratase-related protein [Phenylobacterium sp.]